MEAILTQLANSGAIGLLAAIEAIAIGALWLTLKNERQDRLADIKEVYSVLKDASNAAEKSNSSREAMAAAIQKIADAQQLILAKNERITALLENGTVRRGGAD
jgi:hypothetical protein